VSENMQVDWVRAARVWHELLDSLRDDPGANSRREVLGGLLDEINRLRDALSHASAEVSRDKPRTPAEPTGPRIYVQSPDGKQGHIVAMVQVDHGIKGAAAEVLWYTPGALPVRVNLSRLAFITEADVSRCENGQTGEECREIDLCESCQQDEDAEGDEIEESMGLR